MELVRRSFEELYPSKLFNYDVEVHYSGQFKAYNARVQLRGRALTFRLSKEWRTVDSDIVQGLYQSLFLKMFGGKDTFHTNLYTSFLKKVPMFTERGESEVFLVESFGRVNERLFFGILDQPTIVWGRASRRTLAHYSLHTDTIVVSTIFKDAPQHLLDYVMYHEMLHKKHQFVARGTRNHFHTPEFRADERKFGDTETLEKELTTFLRGLGRRPKRRTMLRGLLKWF